MVACAVAVHKASDGRPQCAPHPSVPRDCSQREPTALRHELSVSQAALLAALARSIAAFEEIETYETFHRREVVIRDPAAGT